MRPNIISLTPKWSGNETKVCSHLVSCRTEVNSYHMQFGISEKSFSKSISEIDLPRASSLVTMVWLRNNQPRSQATGLEMGLSKQCVTNRYTQLHPCLQFSVLTIRFKDFSFPFAYCKLLKNWRYIAQHKLNEACYQQCWLLKIWAHLIICDNAH